MTRLGVEIAQARRRASLTQRQLAERAGCSVLAISNIETGLTHPRESRILIAVAKVLGISAGELLARIDAERAARRTNGKPAR